VTIKKLNNFLSDRFMFWTWCGGFLFVLFAGVVTWRADLIGAAFTALSGYWLGRIHASRP